MSKKETQLNLDEFISSQSNSTETTNIDLQAIDTDNIGMKKPDPSTHSNIAQIDETDELEQRRLNYEKQEKRRRLGISRKKDDDELTLLDTQIISKELIEQNARSNNVTRFEPSIEHGLNEDQVNQRIKEGFVNDNQKQYSKTYRQIFINNIFTFFNILCLVVAVALIIVKEYKNLAFMAILLCNTVIGIVQEIKAKKTIDKLSIVTAPTTTVIRDSLTRELPVKELVLDDIVKFKNGKQISADCIVIEGEIEVNESLLTGESIAVKKGPGDTLYAGSFITSGTCFAKVNRVGQDCYIQKLQAKAKRYSKPKSELLRSLKLITTFITIIIIPLGSIIAIKNHQSASENITTPIFGQGGIVTVEGIAQNKVPVPLAEFTDEDISKAEEDILLSFDITEENFSAIQQIQITYSNKVSGNISISSVDIYKLEKQELPDGSFSYAPNPSPLASWKYNENSFDDVDKGNGYDKYLDGSYRLDSSGEYIITNPFEQNANLNVRLTIQSRGYGYDDTPEEQEIIKNEVFRITVTKTAGSLIGMIPAGLFLLVTIALAVSVVKLAKSKTLVQELYCIEMLARVDCICLDKTGTITDGTMKVKDIIDIAPINPKEPTVDTIMGAFIGAVEDNNLTSIALQDRFGVNFEFKKIATVPFSSARKLSAVTFEDKGTYVLGAPEFVYQGKSKKINAIVAKKASMGYRVLMLAHSEKAIVDGKVPTNCSPIALITLEDHIREEAYDTIRWFKENGVQVKVISGDNPSTVAEIAGKVGIEGANDYISLDGLSPQEVETIANEYTVFGRVSPDQKAILVRTLKRHGKTVAMTGDGVNDILAMKESDCSVAMASGSDAAKNVAHLVLLDSNFANMPKVVLEGRRVINNIQSSASLYLMKTLFVMAITFLSILSTNLFTGYPFDPVQFMLLEFFIIGAPSTLLALQPNKEKIHGNFIANIILNCFSQALCLVLTVVFIYLASARNLVPGLNLDIANSMAVIAITYVGAIILTNICRPFNTLRSAICIFTFACISIALFVPEIAHNLGVNHMFSELALAQKLLLLVVILMMVPLQRAMSDFIRSLKDKSKKHNTDEL